MVTREELPLLLQMVQDELGLHADVLELDKQPAGGLGLLGTDWASAREELLAGGADGDAEEEEEQGQADGSSSAAAASGDAADGGSAKQQGEEKLEAARKGLDDLFNLL